ncbi:hypothetical protein G9A89_002100 [Geosiphon pyriformis]|nr:hypothetical protein G9A89_002100 [Geosiphon pyriformis]
MLPLTDRLFQDILPSTRSSSATCREGELLATEENTGIKKRKGKATATRAKRQKTEGTLLVKMHPNHPQKQPLKRLMGLARFAFNTVVGWSIIMNNMVSWKKDAIDLTLVARKKVIKRNAQRQQGVEVCLDIRDAKIAILAFALHLHDNPNKRCSSLDDLCSMKDKLNTSSKRKLKPEGDWAVTFFTPEFDALRYRNEKIHMKTIRKMLCWAHYRFRQCLITKAEELGVRVII